MGSVFVFDQFIFLESIITVNFVNSFIIKMIIYNTLFYLTFYVVINFIQKVYSEFIPLNYNDTEMNFTSQTPDFISSKRGQYFYCFYKFCKFFLILFFGEANRWINFNPEHFFGII